MSQNSYRMKTIQQLQQRIIACRLCPRLVEYREWVARTKRRMYREEEYWGRPVPGFGDPFAKVLVVGLAPAAHGGNRTGRVFTGDRSGDWVYGTLYRFGFANQPHSVNLDDGIALKDVYITAAARCAPPANKPLREELQTCRPYLLREMELLKDLRVVVALGKIAFDAYLDGLPADRASRRTFAKAPSPVWPWSYLPVDQHADADCLVPSQPAEHPDG